MNKQKLTRDEILNLQDGDEVIVTSNIVGSVPTSFRVENHFIRRDGVCAALETVANDEKFLVYKVETGETLKARQLEFLRKLAKLMGEYLAYLDSTSEDNFILVIDGHLDQSWKTPILLNDLEKESIEKQIKILEND